VKKKKNWIKVRNKKEYIFDLETEMKNGISDTTDISSTIIKQSHYCKIHKKKKQQQQQREEVSVIDGINRFLDRERRGRGRGPESSLEARTERFLRDLNLKGEWFL